MVVWLSGNALASINVVTLHKTQLLPKWVTVCGRGAPDPDPDPAGYPVNFVDPVRIRIRPDPETVDTVEIRIRPDPECLDPAGIRIRPDPKSPDPGSSRILLKHHEH